MSDVEASTLTAAEVGKILTLPRKTVWDHARSGKLPSVRIGRLYRFPRAAIFALAEGKQDEQCDAETRAFLAAGGQLEPMQLLDLYFLGVMANAGPGWRFCRHLPTEWGTILTPLFWSPARPDEMLCGECFGAVPDARSCDFCRTRPSTKWRESGVPSHQREINGKLELLPPIKVRVRLCDVCGSLRPEDYRAVLAAKGPAA